MTTLIAKEDLVQSIEDALQYIKRASEMAGAAYRGEADGKKELRCYSGATPE